MTNSHPYGVMSEIEKFLPREHCLESRAMLSDDKQSSLWTDFSITPSYILQILFLAHR